MPVPPVTDYVPRRALRDSWRRPPDSGCGRGMRSDAAPRSRATERQPAPIASADPPGHPRLREMPVERCLHNQRQQRSEEHTSELQSLMRISYAVFCLKKKKYDILLPNNTL